MLLAWATLVTWRAMVVHRINTARATGERGEALAYAAITVGGVIIAGIILAAVKAKGQSITTNICTNADPATC